MMRVRRWINGLACNPLGCIAVQMAIMTLFYTLLNARISEIRSDLRSLQAIYYKGDKQVKNDLPYMPARNKQLAMR